MLLLLLRANTFLTLWLFVLASKSGESLQHLHMVALDFRRSILQLSPCIFPWKLMSSCYVNLHANEYHQPDEDILIAYICIQGTHLHSRFNHLNVLCNLTRRVPIWLPCTYAKWMPWVFEEILALLLGESWIPFNWFCALTVPNHSLITFIGVCFVKACGHDNQSLRTRCLRKFWVEGSSANHHKLECEASLIGN